MCPYLVICEKDVGCLSSYYNNFNVKIKCLLPSLKVFRCLFCTKLQFVQLYKTTEPPSGWEKIARVFSRSNPQTKDDSYSFSYTIGLTRCILVLHKYPPLVINQLIGKLTKTYT